MSAAGNELLPGLQELNHTKVSPRFRLSCLESLTEPVLAVVAALDKHFEDTAFPQSEKNDKISRVAVQFFRELALGYRLAGDQLANNSAKVSMLNSRSVALCVHRSLSCLEQMMYRAALLYQNVQQQIWNEIHVLYAFAFQNGAHQKSFKDTVGWLKANFSIDDIYKRLAIVGISEPQRLNQRAIRRVYLASELWAQRTSISVGTGIEPAEGKFEIAVDSDEPPKMMVEGESAENPDFVFDISSLKSWLQDVLSKSEDPLRDVQFRVDGQDPMFLESNLLRQLVGNWGVRRDRSYQRLPAQHDINMQIGLNGIHYAAAGNMAFDQFLDQSRDSEFIQSPDALNNWVSSADQSTRPAIHHAHVLNQSLGGYCLRITEVENLNLRVGELVSLCASSIASRDAMWMVGVIRWLRCISVTELEIGVSIIGQSARAAALFINEDPAQKIPPFRGLVIQPFGPSEDTESLIVPAFFARNHSEGKVCVRDGDDFHVDRLRIVALQERTTEFCRYRFELIEQSG
jgi:hypothetical protein